MKKNFGHPEASTPKTMGKNILPPSPCRTYSSSPSAVTVSGDRWGLCNTLTYYSEMPRPLTKPAERLSLKTWYPSGWSDLWPSSPLVGCYAFLTFSSLNIVIFNFNTSRLHFPPNFPSFFVSSSNHSCGNLAEKEIKGALQNIHLWDFHKNGLGAYDDRQNLLKPNDSYRPIWFFNEFFERIHV